MTSLESVRSYWDSRPCNIRHSPQPVGTKEYFDEVEARKYYVEPHIPAFADFPRWNGKRVLEIGCGIGTDTINFARAGARVTAIDLSEESVKLAKQRAELFGVADKIRFFVGDAEQISHYVAPEVYDLIYSFGVIHHSPHPENILKELRKYADQCTRLKLMVYNKWSWKAMWIVMTYGHGAFWRFDDLVREYSEAQTGCPVTYTYTPMDIVLLLREHKWLPVKVEKEHIFPYSIPEYTQYQYKKVWYFAHMPPIMFRWLEQNFGWHLLIDARWGG